MADFDDDAPPPLSSLPEQVDALRLRGQSGESTSGRLVNLQPDESLRVANVVIQDAQGSTRKATAAAAAPAFKKGFFDAPVKRKPKPQHAAGGTQKPAPSAAEEIPMIHAKKGAGDGPSIPDFLRLEPDEEAKRYAAMKSDLLQKLQPTPDMVTQIGKDPSLLAAFDDPEVMAAVNDIAANPGNMKKYQNKPKVVAFYAAMGKLMGEKLQKEQSAKKPTPS